jgi:hypothetical protein
MFPVHCNVFMQVTISEIVHLSFSYVELDINKSKSIYSIYLGYILLTDLVLM